MRTINTKSNQIKFIHINKHIILHGFLLFIQTCCQDDLAVFQHPPAAPPCKLRNNLVICIWRVQKSVSRHTQATNDETPYAIWPIYEGQMGIYRWIKHIGASQDKNRANSHHKTRTGVNLPTKQG